MWLCIGRTDVLMWLAVHLSMWHVRADLLKLRRLLFTEKTQIVCGTGSYQSTRSKKSHLQRECLTQKILDNLIHKEIKITLLLCIRKNKEFKYLRIIHEDFDIGSRLELEKRQSQIVDNQCFVEEKIWNISVTG